MSRRTLNFILLFVISLFSFAFNLGEVLLRGWYWLHWIEYFHISFLVAPILFMLWLNFVWNWKLGIKRNLVFAASYTLCFVILLSSYATLFNRWVIFLHPVYILQALVFPLLILPLLENILLSKTFRLSVRRWKFIIVFFLPVAVHLVAQVLNLVLMQVIPFFFDKLGDMIFQFKTGSVIFAYMLLEGIFILLHKSEE
ncbi:MAG: hypothetical protein K6B43_14595 [Treponema sp.]|nr:hypothetical protein [Treponema sp.]